MCLLLPWSDLQYIRSKKSPSSHFVPSVSFTVFAPFPPPLPPKPNNDGPFPHNNHLLGPRSGRYPV